MRLGNAACSGDHGIVAGVAWGNLDGGRTGPVPADTHVAGPGRSGERHDGPPALRDTAVAKRQRLLIDARNGGGECREHQVDGLGWPARHQSCPAGARSRFPCASGTEGRSGRRTSRGGHGVKVFQAGAVTVPGAEYVKELSRPCASSRTLTPVRAV